jgi:hypothetical protein
MRALVRDATLTLFSNPRSDCVDHLKEDHGAAPPHVRFEPFVAVFCSRLERPLGDVWQRKAHFRLDDKTMGTKLLQKGTQGVVSRIDIDQCQRANRRRSSEEVFQSRGIAGGNLMHEATFADDRSAFFMQERRLLRAGNGFRSVLPCWLPGRISLNGTRNGAEIRQCA